MLFKKPILIYSNYCSYCEQFVTLAMKHPDFFNSMTRICIDANDQTKQRTPLLYDIQSQLNTRITEVPTIITANAEHFLVGVEAFKWLDHHTQSQPESLSGFNSNEMSSFSDPYANFGSTELHENASEQSFRWFERTGYGDQFSKIAEDSHNDSITQNEYNTKQKERDSMNSAVMAQGNARMPSMNFGNNNDQQKINQMDYSKMMSQRNTQQQSNPNIRPRGQIDFTSNDFGYAKKMKGGASSKSVEMDKKLEQLMQERGELNPQVKRM